MAVESFDASDVTSVDELKGGTFLEEAGQYHLVVAEVDETREKGNALRIKFGVLAGTTPHQQNKSFTEFFNDPSPTHKDGGAFMRKRRISLLLATGVITPEHLGKQFHVDWQSLVERQLKAAVKIEETTNKNDSTKKYKNAQISGLEMWGPLDDEAKHIPHDAACIEAAVRRGQVNVVSKYKGPAVAPMAGTAQIASTTAPIGTTGSALPPAVDKYAGL